MFTEADERIDAEDGTPLQAENEGGKAPSCGLMGVG